MPYISFIVQKLANNAAAAQRNTKNIRCMASLSFIAQSEIPENYFNAIVEAKPKHKTG